MIFGKNPDWRDTIISDLNRALADASDIVANEQQLRATAEIRMAAMVEARSPDGIAELSFGIAGQIEDCFAGAWDGVAQRKGHIQHLVQGAITRALKGG